MRRILAATTVALLITTTTQALFAVLPAKAEMSKAGVPAGAWCAVVSENENWMNFKPGKCTSDENDSGSPTLILKPNGDYRFTGVGDEEDCKVNPKSYTKGWADYNCIKYGAREYKQKRHQKFLINTVTVQLSLSMD